VTICERRLFLFRCAPPQTAERTIVISIIIRTKNEERWIGSCLEAISRQTLKDQEVILVDNQSVDKTVAKALQYDVRLVTIDKYRPGAAINRGIEASFGEIVVCLSGHCIPVDEYWLENLVRELDDEKVAGVYGRQEPLAFSTDMDKRDLLITFGLDRREQVKDSFFHNANSAFRRSTWERFPFDETASNIEDRLWASEVQADGFKIVYEPSASVYHYHGIHHNGDPVRCGNVVRIIESISQDAAGPRTNHIDAGSLNVVAVIPVRQEGLTELSSRLLFEYAAEHARSSSLINTVALSVDEEHAELVAQFADMVLVREPNESRFDVILEQLMKSSLQCLEDKGIIPDVLVMLEPTYPFREPALLDQLIREFAEGGFDTVIPARTEYNSCWMEEEGTFHRLDDGYVARQFKKPFYTGLKGLCCVCAPATVRQGLLFGEKVGLVSIDDAVSAIEVRGPEDIRLAEVLLSSGLTQPVAR
jgi:CMP-N-acetylneuraminic acid synthetase